jgi:glutamate transport system substrate-binding protein
MNSVLCRAAAAVALVGLLSSGCGGDEPAPEPTVLHFGLQTDQPGLGFTDTQRHSGFEYDMASWLADRLDVQFAVVNVKPDQREEFIKSGAVDLMIGTYSKTDARVKEVSFAAPYMLTQQGAMVLATDTSLNSFDDLKDGRVVCAARGTTSIEQLKERHVNVFEATGDGACVNAMLSGRDVRAVSTDQLILRGWANHDKRLKVVESVAFGHQERYGIGLKKGDTALCEKVTAALKEYLLSGVWENHFRNNLGPDLPVLDHKPDPNHLDPC